MEQFKSGQLVELVHNAKLVRIASNINESGHYLATLNINNDWPEEAIGAVVYIHCTDILRKVDE